MINSELHFNFQIYIDKKTFTSSSLSESSESSELSGFATTLAGGALDMAAGLATTFEGKTIIITLQL